MLHFCYLNIFTTTICKMVEISKTSYSFIYYALAKLCDSSQRHFTNEEGVLIFCNGTEFGDGQ